MLCYQERHTLLVKCSKPFFRCIKLVVWASLCIFLPLIGLIDTFSTKVDSQNAHKMPYFECPLRIENGMLFYNERQPLLMKCFQTFLKCMRKMGGAHLYILLPLMDLVKLYVPPRLTTKLHKTPDVGYALLSVPKWLVFLKGGTSIAYEVLQNHPEMHAIDGKSSW